MLSSTYYYLLLLSHDRVACVNGNGVAVLLMYVNCVLCMHLCHVLLMYVNGNGVACNIHWMFC